MNRCVNNKKRQYDLEKRQEKYVTRKENQKDRNTEGVEEKAKKTADYMTDKMRKSSKIYQSQKNLLPKTAKELSGIKFLIKEIMSF